MNGSGTVAPRLYDSHVHLQDERLAPYAEAVLEVLRSEGVAALVVNGTREQDWPAVREWARRDSRVIPSFGLHPWYVPDRSPAWQARLLDCLDQGPAALGEIGLDRWIKNYNLPEQEEVFVWQLRLAAQRNLPVSIHCLRAWGRLLELLREQPRPQCGFLLHSYGGPAEMIGPLADLGAYFSLSGHFAQERKAAQAETLRRVPAERLLIETDAPDMLPPDHWVAYPLSDPTTGKPINHPGNIGRIYRFAADLRGEPVEKFASQMEQNFRRFFGPLMA